MIICEVVLITILFLILIISSYTDIKSSIIQNNYLGVASILAIIIDIIYYIFVGRIYFIDFFQNFILLCIIGFILYACNLWAAGDTKLLIVGALCIPGRFYTFWDIGKFPAFIIVLFAFTSAYIYIIGESVYFDIHGKSLRNPFIVLKNLNIKSIIYSYIIIGGCTTFFTTVLSIVTPRLFTRRVPLLFAINFSIVILIRKIISKIDRRISIVFGTIAWIASFVINYVIYYTIIHPITMETIIIAAIALATVSITARHNYKIIPTSQIRAGHILATETVVKFSPSRVKGLPTYTTEDMRTRLGEEAAASIRRWEASKYGAPSVTIVKTIPFAVFICIGFIAFFSLEVAMR